MDSNRLQALPAALQLRILSQALKGQDCLPTMRDDNDRLLASPPSDTYEQLDTCRVPDTIRVEQRLQSSTSHIAHAVLDRLATDGYAVVDGLLPAPLIRNAYHAAQKRQHDGHLAAAHMGTGAMRWQQTDKRGDLREYLQLSTLAASETNTVNTITDVWSTPFRSIAALLTDLVDSLSRELQQAKDKHAPSPALLTYKALQLAYYPPTGARYVRHSDQSSLNPDRRITCLLYITQDWKDERDGGELLLHPATPPEPAVVVSPLSGRLVIFRSDMEHQVRAAYVHRYAITLWTYGDDTVYRQLAERKRVRAAAAAVPRPLNGTTTTAAVEHIAKSRGPASIFVSIAAYRDTQLRATLQSLLQQADRPSRIHIGVLCQRTQEEPADNCPECAPYIDTHWAQQYNVQLIEVPWTEDVLATTSSVTSSADDRPSIRYTSIPTSQAAGPCPARAFIQQYLYAGETFYLQIDSHMRFSAGWDTRLVNDLCTLERIYPLPLLTDYPPNYTPGHHVCPASGTDDMASEHSTLASIDRITGAQLDCVLGHGRLQATHFDSDRMLRIHGSARGSEQPAHDHRLLSSLLARQQCFVAAGFLFGRAAALLEYCPYDPTLRWLFFGEEALYSARLWTHGFRFFAPADASHRDDDDDVIKSVVCWHQWQRQGRANSWRDVQSNVLAGSQANGERQTSQQLVRAMLDSTTTPPQHILDELHLPGGRYGMGAASSLQDYQSICGVSFSSYSLSTSK